MTFFNDMRMTAKLMFSFGIVLTLLLILSTTAYLTTKSSQENSLWVEHTYKVISTAEDALAGLVNMETGYRGFLVTGKDEFLEPYRNGIVTATTQLTQLQELTSDNSGQVARWQDLLQRTAAWQTEVTEPGMQLRRDILIGKATTNALIEFESSGLGKTHFDGMRAIFADAIGEEKVLLNKRTEDSANASTMLLNVLLWGSLSAILMGLLIAYLTSKAISRPLNQVVTMFQEIAKGNLNQRSNIRQKDEIGQLIRTFQDLVTYIQTAASAANALSEGNLNIQIEAQSSQDVLSQSFSTMIQNLSNMIRGIAQNATTLNTTSQKLSNVAQQMAGEATSLSDKSNTVAVATEQMSANIRIVSTSTEEMTATIGEIAQNAETGRKVTSDAVLGVQQATSNVKELQIAANEISKVIEVIMEIAEQTKLLALNATIEAARAGESGKGFAVVASEVKDLAQQTNDATDEIRTKIETMQKSTASTVTEISQINDVMAQVNDLVSSIASAVEEQSITTQDIAKTITETAQTTDSVASDIAEVNQSSGEVKDVTDVINTHSTELSHMGETLQKTVSGFTFNT